ncbi:hypothetical protein BDR26DRAFT_407142 [Obelidium mucronatum]|nr:hypothetical protein BDR26DRAFT_407142 [Obelidium mucronatum]
MEIGVRSIQLNMADENSFPKLKLKIKLRTHEKWIDMWDMERVIQTVTFVMTFHSHLFDELKLDLYSGSNNLTRKHVGRGRADFSELTDWHQGSYVLPISIVGKKTGKSALSLLEPIATIFLGISFTPLVYFGETSQTTSELRHFLERASSSAESLTDEEDINKMGASPSSPSTNPPLAQATRSHFIRTSNFHYASNTVISPTSPTLRSPTACVHRSSILQGLKFPILGKEQVVTRNQSNHDSPQSPVSLSDNKSPNTTTPTSLPSDIEREEAEPIYKSLPTLPKKIATPRILNKDTHLNISEVNDLARSLLQNNFSLPFSRIVKVLQFLYKFENGLPIPRTGDLVKDSHVLEVASRFMAHSLVVYGSLVSGFCSGAVSILDHMRVRADEKTAIEFLELLPKNLLYWDHSKRTISTTRYYIVHDTKIDAIVISIQGTISAFQLLTDVNADYFPFQNGSVHKGIFRAAQHIFETQFKQLLIWVKELKLASIFCTGHSLGAGVCTLLTLLLEEQIEAFQKASGNRDFRVHAHAFATPGVATKPLATKCKHLIDNYVMENDIVPRMSFGTIFAFKELMMEASSILDNKELSETESFNILASKREEILKRHDDKLGMLPGTIYYIYKTVRKIPRRHFSRNGIEKAPFFKDAFQTVPLPSEERPDIPHYVIEFGKPEMFQYLAPRRHLLNHHMPWQYMKSLRGALEWMTTTTS